MEKLTLKEFAVPMIKAIDSFNYLLKSHHRRTAVISYHIGKELQLSNDQLMELVIAASLHDIGALSVQERDMLIKEDVLNPTPHCVMGHRMLSSFKVFKDIAQAIKHHHIKYEDFLTLKNENIHFSSFIIHLADRVDILISTDEFILDQKSKVIEGIREKIGTHFHPNVFVAFEKVAKSDIFWIDINNMTLEQLFRKIDFTIDFELALENILEFSFTISRIIDFRSKFTAAHSYTVGEIAYFIGNILSYSDEICKKLKIAGYLHDIGKIGIDPGLIEKNGPLTEKEFNLMRLHPYYTGQILSELSTSEWFREIVIWAERHHEKSDGSGYPFSLEEKDLDDGVKILGFSDIISALMEERPYRKPLPVDTVFEIIDQQFAPIISLTIFDHIKNHKKEIEEIVKKAQTKIYENY